MYKIYKIVSFYIQIYTNIQVPPMFSLLTYFFFSFSGLVQTVSHKCEWVPKRRERYETRVSGGIEKWDTHIYIIYVCVCVYVSIRSVFCSHYRQYRKMGKSISFSRCWCVCRKKKNFINRKKRDREQKKLTCIILVGLLNGTEHKMLSCFRLYFCLFHSTTYFPTSNRKSMLHIHTTMFDFFVACTALPPSLSFFHHHIF